MQNDLKVLTPVARDQMRAEALVEAVKRVKEKKIETSWPELITPEVQAWIDAGFPSPDEPSYIEPKTGYVNSETKRHYVPHSQEEWECLVNDGPKWVLVGGGWRSGKSVLGIIKILERLKRGCGCIMVSPDYRHFTRSLWMEFERWNPWTHVKLHSKSKNLIRYTTAGWLLYGGIDDPAAWEGPTVNFLFFDEARRKKGDDAMKILMSRASALGPSGEKPQLLLGTTLKMHWLHRYFGPLLKKDPLEAFKKISKFYRLKTIDNLVNIDPDYYSSVSSGLTEKEALVNLDAQWATLGDSDRFLPTITMWELCKGELPALTNKEPMVIAIDAAVGRESGISDCFGMVGVTRHPARSDDVAVRAVHKWQMRTGRKLDFGGEGGPIEQLMYYIENYNVVQVAYDSYQLHYLATELNKKNIAWFKSFGQGAMRLEADKQLQDVILQRRITHTGNIDLREHIDNADKKITDEGTRLRIIKREPGLKIDLCVCLSMSTKIILDLNV